MFNNDIISTNKKTKKPDNSLSRHAYVTNPNPLYQPPKVDMNPPRIINAMRKAARESCVSSHLLWYSTNRYHPLTNKLLTNQRRINFHRKNAINAIMECIAAHVNIITGKVYMTLSNISDACGLTTYNSFGKPCYSRASRAINEHIEAIGAISCERFWDKTSNTYIPNVIWVTKLFFVLINYEYGKFLSAQKQQLNWENQKLKKIGELPITLTEAKRRAKSQHIKFALEMQLKKKTYRKQRRYAQKLVAMEKKEAQYLLFKNLIKLYNSDELNEIGYIKIKKIIEQQYYCICKLSKNPP